MGSSHHGGCESFRDGMSELETVVEGLVERLRGEQSVAGAFLGGSLAADRDAEALVRLRAHAFAHDQSVVEVSRDIVARRLRLSPEGRSDLR